MCLHVFGSNWVFSIVAGASMFEVQFKSDVNTQTNAMPYADAIKKILDNNVGQTDMKIRDILKKFVEVWISHLTLIPLFFDEHVGRA